MLKSEIINIKATIHIFKINARIISDHKSFVDHSRHCWKMASEPGLLTIRRANQVYLPFAPLLKDGERTSFVDHSYHCWKMASEPGLLTIRTIVERWRANQVCWPFALLLKDGKRIRFVKKVGNGCKYQQCLGR